MDQEVISMREIQRNYSGVLRRARKERRPVFLGVRGGAQAVLMDVDEFKKLEQRAYASKQKMGWHAIEYTLDRIARTGSQKVTLSDFVRHDRHSH